MGRRTADGRAKGDFISSKDLRGLGYSADVELPHVGGVRRHNCSLERGQRKVWGCVWVFMLLAPMSSLKTQAFPLLPVSTLDPGRVRGVDREDHLVLSIPPMRWGHLAGVPVSPFFTSIPEAPPGAGLGCGSDSSVGMGRSLT